MQVKPLAKRGFCALAVFATVALGSAAQADVYMTMELAVVPEKSAEFLEVMTEAAHDTRAFEGNKLFHILVDESDPGRVLFYEIWESREDLEAYQAWRAETNFGASVGEYMAGPPKTSLYSIAE